MPRRRYGYNRGYKAQANAQRQAQKIKIQLPNKPNIKDLKNCYEEFVAASPDARIKALNSAMAWFDSAVDYLVKKSQQDASLAKELQNKIPDLTKAEKSRELGVNAGAGLPERETALRMACRRFEIYCSSLSPTPKKDKNGDEIKDTAGTVEMTLSVSIDTYIKTYNDQQAVLEAKEQQSALKFAELLNSMQAAFPDVPFKFKVTDDNFQRKLVGSELCYGKAMAKDMLKTLRKEGILKVVAQEIPHISKAMSVVDDDQGVRLDARKQIEAMDALLKGFVLYAQRDDAPGRILRKGDFGGFQAAALPNPQPAPQNAARTNVRTPRPQGPRPAGTGKGKIAGKYNKGSVIGTIFERMMDGQEHDKSELFAGFSGCESGASAPFSRILKHARSGNNPWTIDINGSKVKLNMGGRP